METIQKFVDAVAEKAAEWLPIIIGALLVFLIGKMVARWISGLVKASVVKGSDDRMLAGFLANLAYYGMVVVVVLGALGVLGIEMTSLSVILGAAGLAIGLSLQGTLGNFASGAMLVFFRPFQVGDVIEAAGTVGKVTDLQLFCTILTTPDNKKVIIPNGAVAGGKIVNINTLGTRRVDMIFGIGYEDDIPKAKQILAEILDADDRVLKDPAHTIALVELADSSVNFVCRPWVNAADYWGVWFDTHETVKARFDDAGVSIPYPQSDVHMHQAA